MNSLSEAITWTRDRWDQQRPIPLRLHEAHTTEGALGAPRFTGAFRAALDGSPEQTDDQVRTVSCYHPLLNAGMPARDCPECFGHGIKEVRVDRFTYPMTLALSKLSCMLRPRRRPHPILLVLTLAEHAFDWRAAGRSMDMHPDKAEPLFLMALRDLHSRYQEGPVKGVSWTQKSDSQRSAETWTAA